MIRKWFCGILFLITLLVVLAGFAPLLVEEFVLPPVLAKAGLADYRVAISRLHWKGCSLHVGGRSQKSSPVITGDVEVDWTPAGLLQRRIEKVSGYGLQINLTNLPAKKKQPLRKSDLSGSNVSLPIIIDQVEIYHGSVIVPAGQQTFYLPFSLSGQRTGEFIPGNPTVPVQFQFALQSVERTINTALSIDLAQGAIRGELDANGSLDFLAPIIPVVSEKKYSLDGTVSISAAFEAQLVPFVLERLTAEGVLEDLQVTGDNFMFTSQENEPAKVMIAGEGSAFLVKSSGLQLGSPVQTAVELDASITVAENGFSWEGNLELTPGKGPLVSNRVWLQEAAKLHIFHAGKKNKEQTTLRLATGTTGDTESKRSLRIAYKDISVAVDDYDIDARIRLEEQSGLTIPSMTLLVQGRNTSIIAQQGIFTIPAIALQAKGRGLAGHDEQSFSAMLSINNADLTLEQKSIDVEGVDLRLPFTLPPAEGAEAGNIRVGTIRMSGRDMASLGADIEQKGETFVIDGYVKTDLLPENTISMSGILRMPEKNRNMAELSFSLQNGRFAMEKIASVLPALNGFEGSGMIDAQGKMFISPYIHNGEADFRLSKGTVNHTGTGTELEDISFSLQFPELPHIRSAPRQHLLVGTVRKNKLVAYNLKTWFEVESPSSVFIEQISGRWSGGRVFTSSFRLQKDQDELDVALFCDRLKLSSILSQFNLAEAGGEGRLSGRIPLAYHDGDFLVDDGFLFSSPGEKGHLTIKQSKYLETTLPADVPHFSPLHFAGAALADFEYNWAKLQVTSEEKNLLLKLQIDGKPKEKLPFYFDTKNNVFVRLGEGSTGGIDQPLKLDVNFNVPVNEMLQFKDKLMPLFKKFN